MNGIRHGKGKEYDKYGNLLFDGEYINRKKRKGKNYYKLDLDKLMEEFEYINNKENAEEKIYVNGKLIFEGKLLNDKMLGGKIYDDASEKMKFEGELFCDVRNKIKGKEYIDGNLSYEGEYLNWKNGMEKDMIKKEI